MWPAFSSGVQWRMLQKSGSGICRSDGSRCTCSDSGESYSDKEHSGLHHRHQHRRPALVQGLGARASPGPRPICLSFRWDPDAIVLQVERLKVVLQQLSQFDRILLWSPLGDTENCLYPVKMCHFWFDFRLHASAFCDGNLPSLRHWRFCCISWWVRPNKYHDNPFPTVKLMPSNVHKHPGYGAKHRGMC